MPVFPPTSCSPTMDQAAPHLSTLADVFYGWRWWLLVRPQWKPVDGVLPFPSRQQEATPPAFLCDLNKATTSLSGTTASLSTEAADKKKKKEVADLQVCVCRGDNPKSHFILSSSDSFPWRFSRQKLIPTDGGLTSESGLWLFTGQPESGVKFRPSRKTKNKKKSPKNRPGLVLIPPSSLLLPESPSPPHKLWKGVPLCSCYTAVVETALRAPC